ncbi:mitochondrial aldehyde dehydrogenase [Diatrype stigma]|uniref:Mitochondrial aldehyde dehydrogenase n=1 Tax=Diatrype stigma TaxID=117547 RepID=A0AAN9ULW5_9PEZI
MEVALEAPNGVKWTQPLGLFINNETEEVIAAAHAATADDVDKAVRAARAAFQDKSWKHLSGTERAVPMNKLADLLETDAHADALASAQALTTGMPYAVARGRVVPTAAATLRYYAGWADKIHGQTIDAGRSKAVYTVRTPLGVAGQIVPWNFTPVSEAAKLGPALACGNTVVLKVSEVAPLAGLYLAGLARAAGFPPGVVNVVSGRGGEAGAAIAAHPGVDKVAFTGSTATAREVLRLAAPTLKNVTLETGGKSPAVVFDDADIDNAAVWTHRGVMALAGQMCSATSRVLVQEGVYERFLARYRDQVEKVSVVGDPFEAATFQGPQVSRAQYDRVRAYIRSARDEGATVYMGGGDAESAGVGPQLSSGNKKGFFVEPTVFTDVKPGMRVYREEIFGPCVVVVPFRTEEEALAMANDTAYGLSAAVFTSSVARAHRVAREFEAGTVHINAANSNDFRVPFGGTKQSGIGSELGEAGLAAYSYTKSVTVNLDA